MDDCINIIITILDKYELFIFLLENLAIIIANNLQFYKAIARFL
jgi:hypothetical protein